MLRALEYFFGSISVFGAAAIIILSREIAAHWLKVEHLPVEDVAQAIVLMGLAIPLRWIAGLYRGVVNGFERQVWLGNYNIIIATLRFIGVIGVFKFFGSTPENFFTYQLILAAAELTGLALITYRLVRRDAAAKERFSWAPFKANLRFSLTIAFTATVWLALIQTDRMVLSKVLTLSAYGIFSIALVAAATVSALNGALGQAILPRLTKLVAEGNAEETARLYHRATQAACVIAIPLVSILAFFSEPVLVTWTGKAAIAHQAAPILRLYAIGNGLAWLSSLPYYLQYAKGNLRLHFIGNIVQILFLVPLIFLVAGKYGPVGTGAVWALSNGLYFLVYVPIVHARFFPKGHWKWVSQDIIPIVLPVGLAAWSLSLIRPAHLGRWVELAWIMAAGSLLLIVAGLSSSMVRTIFATAIRYPRVISDEKHS